MNKNTRDVLENLKIKAKQHQMLVAIAVLSGLIAMIVELNSSSTLPTTEAAAASTFIPDGYVLVPIDVQNPEALDSILGPYGVVDLFTGGMEGRPSRQIARRIKILRAPLNPNHFAVLAPENEAPNLVRESGPVTVVIQNPRTIGTDFVKAKGKRSRIHVESFE